MLYGSCELGRISEMFGQEWSDDSLILVRIDHLHISYRMEQSGAEI